MSETFVSKVDGWLVAACLAPGAILLCSLTMTSRAGHAGAPAILFLISIGMALLFAWVLLGTNYRFQGAALVITSGPFRWVVPIRDIISVEPTRSARSGPALSFDRLRIEYGNPRRAIMISPREQARFLTQLQQKRGG